MGHPAVGVIGSIWIEAFTKYAMWMIMDYLTAVWKLNLTNAALTVNIWKGATEILPAVMLFLADALLGHVGTIFISTLTSAAGLVCLFMSTPQILGTCSEYKPECIGAQQTSLFYAALVLTAIGLSGFKASSNPFNEEQQSEIRRLQTEDLDPSFGKRVHKCFNTWAVTLIPLAGIIAMGYVKQWAIIFGIAAICSVLALVVFLSALHRYDPGDESFHISAFQAVPVIRMIPLCVTLIGCGIVSSIGDTYFVEQAGNLSRKLGPIEVPITLLRWVHDTTKSMSGCMYTCFVLCLGRYAHPTGMAISMVFSVLCCITAAKVETRRLDVVKSHSLIDNPDATVPMSILWLVPQYYLLGALDGYFEKSIKLFVQCQTRQQVRRYAIHFTNAVFGLGIMGSGLSVFITQVITGKDGNMSWFQDTLNRSRVDNYYWTLTVLSSVNLVLFTAVAWCYKYRGPEDVSDEETQREIAETLLGRGG